MSKLIGAPRVILSEKEAFQRVIDGFDQAADGCHSLAQHQPDKAHMWLKMAEVYEVAKQSCWRLMDEAAAKYKGTN